MSLQSISSNTVSPGSNSDTTSDDSVRGTTTVESDASTRAVAKHDTAALEGEGQEIASGKPSKAEEDTQNGTTLKLKQAEVAHREQGVDAINGSNIKNGKQEHVVVIIDDDDDNIPAVQPAMRKRIKLSSNGDAEMAVALTYHNGLPKHGEDNHARLVELGTANGSEPALAKTFQPPSHQELQRPSLSRISSPSPNTPKPHQSLSKHPLLPNLSPQDVTDRCPTPSETSGTSSLGSPGRKDWTAGMYLDFCLTLQHSFDFDAFAAKHDISTDKVLDRFQALVLHPVLNCNEKGRMRLIEGGKARVKEWCDAKKETRKRMREKREEVEEMMRCERVRDAGHVQRSKMLWS